MRRRSFLASLLVPAIVSAAADKRASAAKPLTVGVVGLSHGHVPWVLRSGQRGDIEIVGVAEPDRAVAKRYFGQYGMSDDLLFASIDEMLDAARPEAVVAFNSVVEHLETVQKAAPRGIHVMVEKPLAVSLEHAKEMEALATRHRIHLLTNYETTWYGSHYEARRMIEEPRTGPIRKVVVSDGHWGPREVGAPPEFLEWLTDPAKNGGGALMDFGCYGANLLTWLMRGRAPDSVTASTRQLRPKDYPKVDDDATIIVSYPGVQGVIQASWNWPYNRKDIEIYTATAQIVANKESLVVREQVDPRGPAPLAQARAWRPLSAPHHDPFTYFSAVVRGEMTIAPTDLSALPLNVTAMRILEAAKESSRTGRTVVLEGE